MKVKKLIDMLSELNMDADVLVMNNEAKADAVVGISLSEEGDNLILCDEETFFSFGGSSEN